MRRADSCSFLLGLIAICFVPPFAMGASVGGNLPGSNNWSGTIQVTSSVTVPAGGILRIEPGTLVQLTNNASITASGGGDIFAEGTSDEPIIFERVNTTFTRWGDLTSTGSGSTLTVRHARITRGRVRASSGGTTLLEDSELSEMTSSGIIGGNSGNSFMIRRTWVHDYEDIDLINTRTLAEDSLFERANSDIFELQNSPPGSVLRRCTFRTCLNPNSDGVDMNGCRDVTIDSCLIYDVTDKGITSGSALSASDPTSFGLVVTNCVIYNADIGIGIKDRGTASLFNTTISSANRAVSVYAKFTPEGGHITNGANNILWGTAEAIHLDSDGTVDITHSNTEGGSFPGDGNISADPLWRNMNAKDFLLALDSPCRGAGLNSSDMGPRLPVGAPMAPSNPTIDSITRLPHEITLRFWTDHVACAVLSSPALTGPWIVITNLSPTRPTFQSLQLPTSPASEFFRLISQQQP